MRPLSLVDELGIPGIVDAHVHVFPPELQARIWAHFDGLEPPWPLPHRVQGDELLRLLADAGVRHHTALTYAHRPGLAAELNRFTLDLAERCPQVIPTFTLFPERGIDDLVAEALGRGGRCAKVHPQVGCFRLDDPMLDTAWAALEQAAVPVIAHAGAVDDDSPGAAYCTFDAAASVAGRFPDLPLVIAHAGTPEPSRYLGLMRRAPKVWMDLSGVFPPAARFGPLPDGLVDALRLVADRLVWGSDLPVAASTLDRQLSTLRTAGFTRAELAALLWHNGVRLFGL
jgi:uncharacterized protein